MNTTAILIKTDRTLKEEAQKTAKELGLSLSAVLTAFLKQFIHTKTVTFSQYDEEPSDYLLAALKQSEEQERKGQVISFASGKDALAYLSKDLEDEV